MRDHTGWRHGFPAGGLGPALGDDGTNTIAAREPFDLTAKANPHNARQLRACVQKWLQTLSAPTLLVDDLIMAIYEALANAVDHAYQPNHRIR